MFANGPQCTIAGVPSVVCTRFGSSASLSRAIIGPVAFSASARTGFPLRSCPITILASRARRSSRPEASDRIAMISDAAVIRKPLGRLLPSRCFLPAPVTLTVTFRSARSFMSSVRGHVMPSGSRSNSLP